MAFSLRLALGTLLLFLLWTISLPLYADVVILILILVLSFRSNVSSLVLLIFSLSICLVTINFFGPKLFPKRPYYREHEKYALVNSYQKNVTDVVDVPHGDISAIDPNAPISVQEKRKVSFKTDSLGYRNNADYADQKLIIVGDSYAVGTGTDYSETIPAKLRSLYNIETYSVAFPAGPYEYYANAQKFIDANPNKDFSFIFFYFEGNDFFASEEANKMIFHQETIRPQIAQILNGYDAFRTSVLGKLQPYINYPPDLFILSRRLESEFLKREDTSVSYYHIGSKILGFLNQQSSASMDLEPRFAGPVPDNIAKLTKCAFLVPSKTRAYKYLLPKEFQTRVPEPPPTFVLMRDAFSKFNTLSVDLSPVLQKESERLLSEDKYTFWRDDTHWNGYGMTSVLETIRQCIERKP